MSGVDFREPRQVWRQFVQNENRIGGANRDARAAIDAIVGAHVQLWSRLKRGFILLGVDAIDRAGLYAQFVFGASIGNYVCHKRRFFAIPLPVLNKRKQEAKIYNSPRPSG